MSIALLKDLPIPKVAKLAAAAKDYPCALVLARHIAQAWKPERELVA